MQANDRAPDLTWQAFRDGSKEAFAEIYHRHVRDLLNYGYKVSNDRRLIEDSIQDLFFELWNSRERLSATTSIRFYLFKALRYKIVRNARSQSHYLPLEGDGDQMVSSSHENYLIGLEVQSFQMEHLKDLITKLPTRQREAINLRYYHNFSNEEIARIMGVNYQSACKLIYSALKSLKLNLQVSVS